MNTRAITLIYSMLLGAAPKTPPGLAPCTQAVQPTGDLPHGLGETIRYLVEVDGISVGTVDFKIERRGMFRGLPVVEYRSLFKIDPLVATFMAIEGRAASLVPTPGSLPSQAMTRYRLDDKNISEAMTFGHDAHTMACKQVKEERTTDIQRDFPTPVQDFVSAFYLLRRLPRTEGCAVIYGNERAYTVWLTPDGSEEVKTPAGLRLTDRYTIRYGSDKGNRVVSGKVWLGQDLDRVPYQAEIVGTHRLAAHVHLFQPGK